MDRRECKAVLSIDTSYKYLSVALKTDGYTSYTEWRLPFSHLEKLNPLVERILELNGLSFHEVKTLVLTRGPGYFTSIRVGVCFAKAFSLFSDVDVVTFNSLRVGLVGKPDGLYTAYMNSTRDQVYYQVFRVEGGVPKPLSPVSITSKSELPVMGQVTLSEPSALKALRLYLKGVRGEGGLNPLYVRPPDAVLKRLHNRVKA